jgi:hypothetical protein
MTQGVKMKLAPSSEKVQIKLFVYAGDEKIRHTANHAGNWGWDFECSCGYQSKTGGAIRSYIQNQIKEHKLYNHDYKYA